MTTVPTDTLLADVVATTGAVVATRARSTKVAALADLLARLGDEEVPVVVAFLSGTARQGRIGVGWRTVAAVEAEPAAEPSLTILGVDRTLTELAGLHGPGSQKAGPTCWWPCCPAPRPASRTCCGGCSWASCVTGPWRAWSPTHRQGLRRAPGHSPPGRHAGRRPAPVAAIAKAEGPPGLEAVGLAVLRGIQPMLAQTAADVAEALALATGGAGDATASVEWKLDGARIQVHRAGDEVRIYTRNLNDVTDRLPGIVDLARSLPATALVLDGEAVGVGEDELPRTFQDTMSAFGREDGVAGAGPVPLLRPAAPRRRGPGRPPAGRAPGRAGAGRGPWRIPGVITAEVDEAQRVLDEALAAGHEGVMVKDAASTYDAGRRGGAWRKVKPVHTLDLVVLAVEWGSGRRRGWLSNLHLGARDPEGGFVMVGKTFKGLTDELLTWQTERFLDIATDRGDWVVTVRPEQVVEIALDGVQSSTRYPGGVALRFARVRRYRDDKDLAEADTIDTVRAMLR